MNIKPRPPLDDLDFECFDNWLSRWVCQGILDGETYPLLPGIGDVRLVVDVGANCGAASVYFAVGYPDAVVHAIEPGSSAYARLVANTAKLSNVRTYNIGLCAADRSAPLYAGTYDSGLASVHQRPGLNRKASELVTFRAARDWLREQGIDRVDVLKVDVEGSEVEILESLADVLPAVKALYVEYDSTTARRRVDRLVEATHDLCHGVEYLDYGEVIYVSRQVLESDPATREAIVELFRSRIKVPVDG